MRSDATAVRNRLARIEGQVRGLQRMVDEDAYCVDILVQIAAVRTALERVGVLVFEDHVRGCIANEQVDELLHTVERFARLR